MAKMICCDRCRSINVQELNEVERDRYTTAEDREGLCGSRVRDYVHHCKVYKHYKCNDCGFEFEELDRSY